MSYLRILTFFFPLIILVYPARLAAQQDWKYFKSQDGITVYTRELKGCSENEFKAIMVVNCPLEYLGSVLLDIPSYNIWLYGCKEAKKLLWAGSPKKLAYFWVKSPWPFYDRDVIYNIRFLFDEKRKKMVTYGSAVTNHSTPVFEKRIRIIDANYKTILLRLTPDRTKIIYKSRTNMGGEINAFESNIISGNFIYNSMRNLKKTVRNRRYTELAKEFDQFFIDNQSEALEQRLLVMDGDDL